MQMKKIKLIALILVVITALAIAACSSDDDNAEQEPQAPQAPVSTERRRTIRIDRIEGNNATITRDSDESNARRLQNIRAGNSASTGEATNMYLNLNRKSLLKMDGHTEITLDKASARSLTLTLVEGAFSADIMQEHGNDTYEFKAGDVTLTIRGTSLIIEYREESPLFIMLVGSGNFDRRTSLEAGHMATVEEGKAVIEPLVLSYALSDFVLDEIIKRAELLKENNVFTQRDIEYAIALKRGEIKELPVELSEELPETPPEP